MTAHNNCINADWQLRCVPLPAGYAERYVAEYYGGNMSEILELQTVKEMENTLKNSDVTSAYRIDGIKLLKKWKSEIFLKKDEETKKLIDKLIEEYDN